MLVKLRKFTAVYRHTARWLIISTIFALPPAIALADYKFTVTDLDIDSYPIIITYLEDDKPISVRQLGPLRIMFPFDEHPELRTLLNESSAVWQLLELTLP